MLWMQTQQFVFLEGKSGTRESVRTTGRQEGLNVPEEARDYFQMGTFERT